MKAPALPADENERLADLYDYGILDTPAERIFDEAAQLAATICGTEIGAVTLIDRDRQWFKSQHGSHFGETSRDESICGHAILHRELFEVPDTSKDERFAGNPLLQAAPGIRFYGGSQLNSGRGHPVGMLCVMDSKPRELTAVQREALRQLADLVEAVMEAGRHTLSEGRKIERMKDEFVSVVIHELRTPLTSIHGAIKLLEQGAGGQLPDHAMHLIELAAQNTQRLRQIVDDILDLDKIASGRMEFDIEPLRAREVLERVSAAYSPAASASGVVLRVDADPALHLRADSRRLHQVLANLVSNAVKFAPAESAVTLTADTSPEDEGRLRLEVMDRGPGIPDAFRKQIFERFAQADMQSSRSKGGSGLGLAIARQMTEQMGGSIGFTSRPGATVFFVDLPREKQ